MSKQIVISGNRILAHGEDCFVTMGGVVICPDTGRIFQNSTIVTVDEVPADIDTAGYEYHAGKFVPCAPYGVGNGNIAVLCPDSCKALKDSGIPLDGITHHEIQTYPGAGKYGSKNPTVLTFNIVPTLVFIHSEGEATTTFGFGVISGKWGAFFPRGGSDTEVLNVQTNGKTISFYHNSSHISQCNSSDVTYTAIAFGKREE